MSKKKISRTKFLQQKNSKHKQKNIITLNYRISHVTIIISISIATDKLFLVYNYNKLIN